MLTSTYLLIATIALLPVSIGLVYCAFAENNYRKQEILTGWAVITVIINFCVCMAFIIAITNEHANRINKKVDIAKAKAAKMCYPYVLTHEAEIDNTITFDCANDHVLQTVRIK